MPDASQIEEAIVRLLQEPDGQVSHQVAITLLSRQFGVPLQPEAYFAAVDALTTRGLVGRARGQGGKVFLLKPDGSQSGEALDLSSWPEPPLMPCLGAYLEKRYWRNLDRPTNSLWWGESRARRQPLAVHEALAQTRQTHFGTLVWHLPNRSRYESRLPEVCDSCEQHGIGLVRIHDPQDTETWERVIEPERKATPLADIDGFLAARLSDQQKSILHTRLKGDV